QCPRRSQATANGVPAMTDIDALERALRASTTSELDGPLPDIAEQAARAGLLDVAYATADSPLGKLLLAATACGLVRLAYVVGDDEDAVLEQLARTVSPRLLAAPARLDEPRRELDEYFSGVRRRFDLPLDWRLTRGFAR